MTEIAVLTPDAADPSYAGQWPGVLERLAEAIATAGLTAVPTAWTDHIEDASGLMRFPLVLPVIAWGYHRDHDRWMQACATWESAGVRMLNPPSVLAWNSDKSYLGRLAEQGVAIPDTVWIDGPTQADADAAFDRFGVDQIVVKPRVSGGAYRTLRLSRGEPMVGAPEGPAMIQPYLPSIESEGETSLLFFGGRLSHVVNKRPVPGEFRAARRRAGAGGTDAGGHRRGPALCPHRHGPRRRRRLAVDGGGADRAGLLSGLGAGGREAVRGGGAGSALSG